MTIPGLTVAERLWNRGARVKMNGKLIAEHLDDDTGHRIAFNIERHNRIEPNTAEVRVWGLSKTVRTAITAAFDAARKLILGKGGTGSIGDLVVEAGNDGVLSQICKMDVISIEHVPLRPGFVTVIKGQDGVLPFQNSFVNTSIAPGVDANVVKTLLVQSMKVAFLDADSEAAFQEAFAGWSQKTLPGGMVLQGPTRKVMTDFLDSLDLAWSHQDGKLVLLRFDQTTKDVAVLLSPDHGLQRFVPLELGRARVLARLNPLLLPGRQVQVIDGNGVPKGAGIFRTDRAMIEGDTDEEGPWSSTLELRPATLNPA